MRCGVLCDKDGKVKRTWAIFNDIATVLVENGDLLIEWTSSHGLTKEQDRIGMLKTKEDVLAHSKKWQHKMMIQKVVIAAPSNDLIYYNSREKLHHRIVDPNDDVKEIAAHSSHKLQTITDA